MSKVPLLIEHIRNVLESEPKVVVFAHHLDVVDGLVSEFKTDCTSLTGRDSDRLRQEAVDKFQNDPSCRIFIGTIGAAGKGLTLTSSAHVIFAELDWVPANITQAEDRCHRIGQRESVLVQHLVVEGSLDATMAERLVAKQQIIDRALDDPVKLEELKAIPLLPVPRGSTASATYPDITDIASELSTSQVRDIHRALKLIDSTCDGAVDQDGVGFNKFDAHVGHELAERPSLSNREAALGWILLRRYRKQVPADLVATALGEPQGGSQGTLKAVRSTETGFD